MTITLTIKPGTDRYDPESDAWADQEQELFDELHREVGGVRRDATPGAGEKGVVETVLIALAGAGAFNGAFECLRAWITRDRTRRVEISYTVDGRAESFVLSGHGIDSAEYDRLVKFAMARLEKQE
ncbi:hypothetical protein [Actinoplanes sp. NPDC089786]|uniref:effector-associated constant component EACC1 n=1 Tax=Actinoplanes sp. NPDC089786 TaxID=3155185 RepID=UPI00341FFCB2